MSAAAARVLRSGKRGFSGQWILTFQMLKSKHSKERALRIERVKVVQLWGSEVRATIVRLNDNEARYEVNGRFEGRELVSIFWSPKVPMDNGTFRVALDDAGRHAHGEVSFYNENIEDREKNQPYDWYLERIGLFDLGDSVDAKTTGIDAKGMGVFAKKLFEKEGDYIGKLKLKFGKKSSQGTHTILYRGAHRSVKPPWRFLNHACNPNAEYNEKTRVIRARSLILPLKEITIDYRKLNEEIGYEFPCECPLHKKSDKPVIKGGKTAARA